MVCQNITRKNNAVTVLACDFKTFVKVNVSLVMFLWLVTKANRTWKKYGLSSCLLSPENRLFHIRKCVAFMEEQLWVRHSDVSTHNKLFLISLRLTHLNGYLKWRSLLYIVDEYNTTNEFCKKKKYTPSENLQCQNSTLNIIYVKSYS